MAYFSRRNQHVTEFSGYEEVTPALRKRLTAILKKYVRRRVVSYSSDFPFDISPAEFSHEVTKEFPGKSPFELIEHGEFHEVFTVVEIFLDMVEGLEYRRKREAPIETLQAFKLSGAVYTINGKNVELVVDEELAKKIEATKEVLSANPSAYEKFFEAIGDYVGRRAKPEDIVKDVFIAFEDYLKEQTGAKDYGKAVSKLEKGNTISSTQRALMEKLYAYRSDTYGVGHAGNSEKPKELDVLWFIETVIAQLSFIDKKLKQH